MNRELLESITDLTYAQARFFSRPSPFHIQRQFLAIQDRILNLLTQFPARLPPPAPTPTPASRQIDIPINLIQTLFGPDAFVGLGQNNTNAALFWEAVSIGLTPEQFTAATRDYENPPDVAEQDQCSICQEGITTEAAIHTLCPGPPLGDGVTVTNHNAFHHRCAQTWFSLSTRCPVCRADLRTLNPTTTNAGAGAPGGEPDPSSGSVHPNV